MKQKKIRIIIPTDIAAEALFTSDRTCCVCNVPGKPLQLHHINEDPSDNTLTNLAVLCLDCHNETMLRGGFGRKLDESQIIKYRAEWLARIQTRKAEADKLASIKTVVGLAENKEYIDYKDQSQRDVLVNYLNKILILENAQLIITKTKWDDHTTLSMKQRCYDMIDFYEEVLKELATFYPPNHFTSSPSKYFNELIASRYTWHRLVCEPFGIGKGGTVVGVSVAASVQYDLKRMINRVADELIYQFELKDKVTLNWKDKWLEQE